MLVVDTSAFLEVLAATKSDRDLVQRLSDDSDVHAPQLMDIEFIYGLRRLVRRGGLSTDRAEDARRDFADLTVVRYPHPPLVDRIWQVRENLTAYDGCFVALAELLGVPPVTCDRSLSTAPHHAQTEVYGGQDSSS